MKTTPWFHRWLPLVIGFVASAASAQIVTNWVAYNDHRPGPIIPPHIPTATSWGTAMRVTGFDMGAPGDTIGVNLTNFLTGDPLPVTLTATRAGAPDDFGTVTPPGTNTPAGQIFFRVCDLSNVGIVGVDAGDTPASEVTLTFNNLNPDKRYLFRGTSARGNNYLLRWTAATLLSVEGFIDAHSAGVITSNDFPASLGAGSAAWNSGENKTGAVVGWDFISPGADGTFSIICTQYIGQIPGGLTANDVNYGYSFAAILLAEVESSPPVITTNPPAQTTVEQNRSFSLSVAASGTPLLYQWHKVGVGPIAGATFATYSVAQAALSDSGDYFVVVYNPLSSVTSTVARVTVNADVTPPALATVFSFPAFDPASQAVSLNDITIEFSEPVDPVSAGTAANYVVPGGGMPASVMLTNNRTVILGLSAPLNEDTDYSVTASGIKDVVGNTAGTLTRSFHTWARSLGNGLLFEAYAVGTGVETALLTNSPLFPDSPFFRTNLWAFDTRVVYPDDAAQGDYGGRVSGVFIPPVSGNWVFFLRTYDRGEVRFNPNGTDASGAVTIFAEITGNEPRDWNKIISAPFSLRAGQGYYIEGLYKAAMGTDVIKVAARLQGTGLPTLGVPITQLDTNALTGGFIGFPLAPRDLGGTLTIVQQPTNISAEENHFVTFSVGVNNPSGLPVFYQWFRNGAEIPGANGPSYTFQAALSDSGATFSVRASKVGSVVTSQTATLTVMPDTTPPIAIEALSSPLNLSNVIVRFNELMIATDLQEEFSFILVDAQTPPQFATNNADGMSVTLTFDQPLVANNTYQLQVQDVRDLAQIQLSPNPTILTFVAGGDLPRLRIVRSGSTATVSWPAHHTGYILEETTVPGGAWAAAGGTPPVVNGRFTLNIGIGSGTRIFRLRQ